MLDNYIEIGGKWGDDEARIALSSLYEVLYNISKPMAPFTSFFAEYIYQFLCQFHPGMVNDVAGLTEDADGVTKSVSEQSMKNLQSAIDMGRVVRVAKELKGLARTPLVLRGLKFLIYTINHCITIDRRRTRCAQRLVLAKACIVEWKWWLVDGQFVERSQRSSLSASRYSTMRWST